MYCVWQVVKTLTVISSNPVFRSIYLPMFRFTALVMPIASKGGNIPEWLIGKNLEECGFGLIGDNRQVFANRDWYKLKRTLSDQSVSRLRFESGALWKRSKSTTELTNIFGSPYHNIFSVCSNYYCSCVLLGLLPFVRTWGMGL